MEVSDRIDIIGFRKTGSGRCDLESHHSVRHPTSIIGAVHLLAENEDIANAITVLLNLDITVEVEAKAKELAVLKLIKDIKKKQENHQH